MAKSECLAIFKTRPLCWSALLLMRHSPQQWSSPCSRNGSLAKHVTSRASLEDLEQAHQSQTTELLVSTSNTTLVGLLKSTTPRGTGGVRALQQRTALAINFIQQLSCSVLAQSHQPAPMRVGPQHASPHPTPARLMLIQHEA